MANRLRETKGLNTDTIKNMNAAWHHAASIRRPLNILISIRPLDIDKMMPAQRSTLFKAVRNKLGVYSRQHGFPFTAAWSREINKDGTGEHLHVLMHVPRRWREHIEDTITGWFPGPGEADVTTANQRTRISSNGKRLSAIAYISKQMDSKAWFKRGLIRQAGGDFPPGR